MRTEKQLLSQVRALEREKLKLTAERDALKKQVKEFEQGLKTAQPVHMRALEKENAELRKVIEACLRTKGLWKE